MFMVSPEQCEYWVIDITANNVYDMILAGIRNLLICLVVFDGNIHITLVIY